MSICAEILKGFDLECLGAEFKKYYQQIVLVNKKDVDEFYINSSTSFNRIYFNLLEGKTGFLFRSTENASSFTASFDKTERKGVVYYSHKLQVPIVGANEEAKTMLKQLDFSNYFAAIHFKDGTIEIHGFKNGLKTDGYTYEPQGMGGAMIPLVSRYDEYDPPYTYFPSLNDGSVDAGVLAITDFNNLFANIPAIYQGDFNSDYNSDFFITGA